MKIRRLLGAALFGVGALSSMSVLGLGSTSQAQEEPWTYWLGGGGYFLEGSEPNYSGMLLEARLGYDVDPNVTVEGGFGGSPFMEGRDYPAPHPREGTYNGRNSPGENWLLKSNLGLLYHFVGNDEDRTIDPYVSAIAGMGFYGKWREGSNWSPFYGPGAGLNYWFSKDFAIRGDYSFLFAQDGKQQQNHTGLLMAFYRFGGEDDSSLGGSKAAKEAGMNKDLGQRSTGPLKTIYYDFDRSEVKRDQQNTLKENAEWMKANPAKKVSLEGHCDERGTNEYNLALGARRAKSAYDYLRTLGIPKDQLTTQTFGEELPADPGHNEAAWSKNRRTESVVK